MAEPTNYPGVFTVSKQGKRLLCTKNLVKGFRVHDELVFKEDGEEYRAWDPRRSKLAAAMMKGLRHSPFQDGTRVLYLGAANGVTPSFVSDIVGERGVVYAVEFSARAMRDLLRVCETRENLLPLLADARLPGQYAADVERVDVLYEDVADRDQAAILIENGQRFLAKGGYALIAIKARCVDAIAPPRQVYSQIISQLQPHFEVLEKIDLFPFERDHLFLVLRKK